MGIGSETRFCSFKRKFKRLSMALGENKEVENKEENKQLVGSHASTPEAVIKTQKSFNYKKIIGQV